MQPYHPSYLSVSEGNLDRQKSLELLNQCGKFAFFIESFLLYSYCPYLAQVQAPVQTDPQVK